VVSLGGSENAIKRAFSSQVVSLGGSENAIKQVFSSQVVSLGGSENAIRQTSRTRRDWQCDLSLLTRAQAGQSALACESPSLGKLWQRNKTTQSCRS
jgi:hypothetical protein